MAGFATYDKGGGVPGTTVYADNVDFTGTGRTNTITTDGQLLIGATAANAGGNHINVGKIVSPLGTLNVGFSSPNITLDLVGGGRAVDSIIPDSGTSPVVPDVSGNISILGSGSITTVGSLNTETIQLTGLTNHAVLVGAGTATITKLAVGATGTVLAGSTGADPAFTASPTVTSITLGSGTALSNYVENTFTPTIDGSTPGTTTYAFQIGMYTRIGNVLYYEIDVSVSTATGTGNLVIGNLPFTVKATANTGAQAAARVTALAWPASSTMLTAIAVQNTTTLLINGSGSSATPGFLQIANTAFIVRVCGFYFI